MSENNAIGGFFELENPGKDNDFHLNGYGFSNGRACFRVILQHSKPQNVHVPFYCCDTLLSPLIEEGIHYQFYSLDETFESLELPDLGENELFLYINYFGLKTDFVDIILQRYGNHAVIDDTQNYFAKGYSKGWSFNSTRKFFGVPDGGYIYSPYPLDVNYERNRNFITDHLVLRLDRRQEEGYEFFRKNEIQQNSDPFLISHFSESILKKVDYQLVAEKRRNNFQFYARHLGELNELQCFTMRDTAVPFCYPFLKRPGITHSELYANNIYLPVFWKEVIDRNANENFFFERTLSSSLLPLPVDHRYDEKDLLRVIDLIN